jgi:prepilin-type N-terminal cleavage/methylation domain-containing protein
MKRHMHQNTKGFTLIEVLVALGIVAVVSLLAWRGLDEVLRSARRVTDVDNTIQTTQATFTQLEQDLKRLNLGNASPDGIADEVSMTSDGLLIRCVDRTHGPSVFRKIIRWSFSDQGLQRTEQQEGEEVVSAPPPLPFEGMQMRLLLEHSGWSTQVTLGRYVAVEWQDVQLEGTTLTRPTPSSPQTERIKAVEVGLTQSNHQTALRLLVTGGVY